MADNNSNAPMGKAVGVAQATQTAVNQKTGDNKPATQTNEPDFSKMTGAEAKAYVEAQKAAQEAAKGQPGRPAGSTNKSAVDGNKEAIADAAKEAARKLKLKHDDGTEEELDEAEVLRIYKERKKHQSVASKELNEGRALRKQAEQFLQMMKDPAQLHEVIKKLGHDPRKMAENFIVNQLAEDEMDPRDKELRDAKAKLRKIEEMEEQQRKQIEAQRLAELKQKYAKEYETQFVDALKESGLPPTKPMVAEIAKYISRSAKIGYKMTPSEAAQLVKEDVSRAQMSLYKNADGETLLRLFGDDVAQKILQARGAKVKSPEAQLKTPSQQGEPNKRSEPKGRMSNKDWMLHKRGLK